MADVKPVSNGVPGYRNLKVPGCQDSWVIAHSMVAEAGL